MSSATTKATAGTSTSTTRSRPVSGSSFMVTTGVGATAITSAGMSMKAAAIGAAAYGSASDPGDQPKLKVWAVDIGRPNNICLEARSNGAAPAVLVATVCDIRARQLSGEPPA